MKEAALHLGVKKDTTRASPRLRHRSAQKTWKFPSRFWEVEGAEEGTVRGEAALSCGPGGRAGRRGRTICQMCLQMKGGVPCIPQLVCPWVERPLTRRMASCSWAFHGSPCLSARLQNHDPEPRLWLSPTQKTYFGTKGER